MQSNRSSNFVHNRHYMIVRFGETIHPRITLRKDRKCTAQPYFEKNAWISSMT